MHAPTLEERMDDIRAVMDAVGSERAALLGYSEGGAMAALFAAAHPERTTALVMYESWVCGLLDVEQNPGGERWLEVDRGVREAIACWGDGLSLHMVAPSLADRPLERRLYGAFERASMSPGMALALWESFVQGDVRHVLPTIGVPTLIVHHTAARSPSRMPTTPPSTSRQRAWSSSTGIDHLPITHDADRIADEIEEFLTGARGAREPDRVLATVLFTDIVGSTDRAAELGDRGWRELLERHNALVRDELEHFQGREVKHTGDGFLATFDGPARAIRCACAIRDGLLELGIETRVGLHTGECELLGDDVGGMAIHIGARVMGAAGVGRDPRLEHGQGPGRRVGDRVRGTWHAHAQGRARAVGAVRRGRGHPPSRRSAGRRARTGSPGSQRPPGANAGPPRTARRAGRRAQAPTLRRGETQSRAWSGSARFKRRPRRETTQGRERK